MRRYCGCGLKGPAQQMLCYDVKTSGIHSDHSEQFLEYCTMKDPQEFQKIAPLISIVRPLFTHAIQIGACET